MQLNESLPSTSNGPFHTTDMEDELHSARLKLKMAEIEERISEISRKSNDRISSHRNFMNNFKQNVEKKCGQNLFHITAMDVNQPLAHMNSLKKQLESLNSIVDYDAEPYTFRIPSLGSQVCNAYFANSFVSHLISYMPNAFCASYFMYTKFDSKRMKYVATWIEFQ